MDGVLDMEVAEVTMKRVFRKPGGRRPVGFRETLQEMGLGLSEDFVEKHMVKVKKEMALSWPFNKQAVRILLSLLGGIAIFVSLLAADVLMEVIPNSVIAQAVIGFCLAAAAFVLFAPMWLEHRSRWEWQLFPYEEYLANNYVPHVVQDLVCDIREMFAKASFFVFAYAKDPVLYVTHSETAPDDTIVVEGIYAIGWSHPDLDAVQPAHVHVRG